MRSQRACQIVENFSSAKTLHFMPILSDFWVLWATFCTNYDRLGFGNTARSVEPWLWDLIVGGAWGILGVFPGQLDMGQAYDGSGYCAHRNAMIARKYADRFPWEAPVWGWATLLIWLSLWHWIFLGILPLWIAFSDCLCQR